ncbi:MAG TPA: WD40 repeat domain-containing protein, partial [Pirellulaceae bacterium]|nr:WD40 repeat domain-containing protein [Pirellulaceae bacterium]
MHEATSAFWDLLDLCDDLRAAGFRIATQQCVAAEQILMQLASDGRLGDDQAVGADVLAEVARYLGPLFCSTAEQQQRFPELLKSWATRRATELKLPSLAGMSPAPDAAAKSVVKQVPPKAKLWGVSAIALSALLSGGILSPLQCDFPWLLKKMGLDRGSSGSSTTKVEPPVTPPSGNSGAGPRPVPPVFFGPAQDPNQLTPAEERARLPITDVKLTRDYVLEPDPIQRPWKTAAAPLIAASVWLIWTTLRRRRPVLQRILSRTPAELREVRIPGAARRLLPGLPIRQTAVQLRHRVRVPSAKLDAPATLAATLNNAGLLTPVFGSRVEPDYLVLIDRASLLDHHAHLADEIVATLALSNVAVDKYYFDGDPRLCLPAEFRLDRSSLGHAHRLDELMARHSTHRVLLFTDGAGFFDSYTGEPASWLSEFDGGRQRAVLTPVESRRWGRREWSIEKLGFPVLPLSADGIAVLGHMFGENSPKRQTPSNRELRTPSFARLAHRWLDRAPPRPEALRELLDDLEHELTAAGFEWLAACAVYPELHWGITLRTGLALVSETKEFERLLPRICRLIWFREGMMPDWLRSALLDRLKAPQRERVRDLVLDLLAHATDRPGESPPLRISIATPRPASAGDGRRSWTNWFGEMRRRFAAWSDRRRKLGKIVDAARGAADDAVLRDYVFLRFVAGQSLDALAPQAPRSLMNLLFPRGARALGLRRSLVAGLAIATSVVAWFALSPSQPLLVDFGSSVIGPDFYATWSDGTVSRWSRQAAPTLNFDAAVRSVEFNSDGTRLLVVEGPDTRTGPSPFSDDKTEPKPAVARVYDTANWQLVTKLGDAQFDVRRAKFSGDGKVIGLSDSRGKIRLYSATTFEQLPGESQGTGNWTLADLNKDGSRFLVFNDTYYARIYDAKTRKVLTTMSHESNVTAARLSGAGDRVATCTRDGDVHVWDVGESDPAKPIATITRGGGAPCTPSFSPDGSSLLLGDLFEKAQLWVIGDDRPKFELPHVGANYRARFSQDGRRIITTGEDGTARVWDAATGRAIGEPLQHEGMVFDASLSPSGDMLATASLDQVFLWNSSRKRDAFAFKGQERGGKRVTVSESGRLSAPWGDGRRVFVWKSLTHANAASVQWGPPIELDGDVTAVAFQSPAHSGAGFEFLITGCTNGTVKLWVDKDAQWIDSGEALVVAGPVRAIVYDANQEALLVADKDGKVWLSSLERRPDKSGMEATSAQHGTPTKNGMNAAFSMLVARTGPWIWSALFQPAPKQSLPYDSSDQNSPKPLRPSEIPQKIPVRLTIPDPSPIVDAKQPIVAMTVDPTGRLLATLGADNVVRFWSLSKGSELPGTIKSERKIQSLSFSSGSLDRQALLVGFETGTLEGWTVEPVV